MKKSIIEVVIKKYRNFHGLSRRELAEKLKVSTRLIETYEYGKVVPPIDRLKELIVILDIPVLEFFSDILPVDGQRVDGKVNVDGKTSKAEARVLKYNHAVIIIELNPELLEFIIFYGKHSEEFKNGKILRLLEKLIKTNYNKNKRNDPVPR